jgi:Zn-dependent M16 (insulinase) family peptidase
MSIAREKKRILSQLNALKSFGNTTTVRKLRKELNEALKRLSRSESMREPPKPRISKKEQRRIVSIEKSSKLKKYHHYIRLIHDNYPEMPYPDIRRMFKLRKQGTDVSIPDVVWQNPSP